MDFTWNDLTLKYIITDLNHVHGAPRDVMFYILFAGKYHVTGSSRDSVGQRWEQPFGPDTESYRFLGR